MTEAKHSFRVQASAEVPGKLRQVMIEAKHTFRVQPNTEVPGEVGEEALVVQVVAQQLRKRAGTHGLAVDVLVHHIPHLQHLLQRPDVCLEPC